MYNQMLKEMGQLVTISLPSSTCLRLLYRRNLRRPTLGTSLPLTCCTSPTAPYLTLSLLFPIRHPLRSIASFTRALHQASSHYLDSVFTCIDVFSYTVFDYVHIILTASRDVHIAILADSSLCRSWFSGACGFEQMVMSNCVDFFVLRCRWPCGHRPVH